MTNETQIPAHYMIERFNDAGESLGDVDIRTLSHDQLDRLRDEAGCSGDFGLIAAIDSVIEQ